MVVLGVHLAARQPRGWPGASWPQATPASQGFSSAAVNALNAIDRDARSGVYGNLDHLVVIRTGFDVWAGRGFGGQLLLIIPSRDIVAVINAWNVFGTPARNIFGPLLDALTADGQP